MNRQSVSGADNGIGQYPGGTYNILLALETIRRLMTCEEVAQLLGESIYTIYRMAQRHKIPAMRAGGWSFDPSALALWLAKKDPTLAQAARAQSAQAARDNSKAA
jgi:excisionase family DNA binding protein